MISLSHITLRAGTFHLRDLSLEIPAGSHTVLMGRTGSGKTTLLEGLCGLRPVLAGSVRIGGRDVTHLPPGGRGIGLVPQDGALFDHLSVRQHLGFALEVRGWSAERREARVRELADWLHLGPLLERLPAGLSGGERQRVALGRALSFEPPVLCLDEPLSALDDQTRQEILGLLAGLRSRSAITLLHITHNRSEAEQLADRILHLRDGRLES
ncbi:MAG: ABC transporter ATP-binding protein [Verrucomicrobium sp.]|jgi:molybdate/tungstate transport system ATP-binding protein|nr:ABC transporter ATP-binding protein [Verrucomicrobium sp.]